MSQNANSSSRSFFRLEYPPEVQPLIQFEKGAYPVINLSEGGVKFQINTRSIDVNPLLKKTFKATITFSDSEKLNVTGKIIRFDKDYIVLHLSEGVPLQKIMSEQRFLLNKYGTLRRSGDL